MDVSKFPLPAEGFVVTHMLIVEDIPRSVAFYRDVLGGEVVFEGGVDSVQRPSMVKLANTWIIINIGGGPTEDKPEVTVAPPPDPNLVSSFLNLRVADIQACYEEWSVKGAQFLTPPQDRGAEIRCYIRDPDGHLIEVGQTTGMLQVD
jgi:catechol 2,3-dioxygenase-like lactoylglutathione lyase family enzyme